MRLYQTSWRLLIDLESITAIQQIGSDGAFLIFLKLHEKPDKLLHGILFYLVDCQEIH